MLHSADWNHDESGNLTVYDPAHPVTTLPNTIGPITFTYDNYGDQDASVPTADASMVTSWASYPSDASVIVYDDNEEPESGQIVFFQFDYLAGSWGGMSALLENTVTYLMAQEGPPTGVDDELDTPVTYVLRGVSPNPFNPVTTVSYGSPTGSRVHLAIYNVAGRHVRTLVDGEVDPGYHSVVWDGRDNNGVEVGSGVYFCRMEAEGFDDSTKMVLLK